MYQRGIFIFLFATLFTENALADRGEYTYEHPSPHHFSDQDQWNEYGFSEYTWSGTHKDERDDNDSNSYDNDKYNKDLLQNEPE